MAVGRCVCQRVVEEGAPVVHAVFLVGDFGFEFVALRVAEAAARSRFGSRFTVFVDGHSIAEVAFGRVGCRDESDDVFANDFDRFDGEFFAFGGDDGESEAARVVNGFRVQYHGGSRGIKLDVDSPFVACFFDSVLQGVYGFPVHSVHQDPFHDVADVFAV